MDGITSTAGSPPTPETSPAQLPDDLRARGKPVATLGKAEPPGKQAGGRRLEQERDDDRHRHEGNGDLCTLDLPGEQQACYRRRNHPRFTAPAE